jgi:hypothetical protein
MIVDAHDHCNPRERLKFIGHPERMLACSILRQTSDVSAEQGLYVDGGYSAS